MNTPYIRDITQPVPPVHQMSFSVARPLPSGPTTRQRYPLRAIPSTIFCPNSSIAPPRFQAAIALRSRSASSARESRPHHHQPSSPAPGTAGRPASFPAPPPVGGGGGRHQEHARRVGVPRHRDGVPGRAGTRSPPAPTTRPCPSEPSARQSAQGVVDRGVGEVGGRPPTAAAKEVRFPAGSYPAMQDHVGGAARTGGVGRQHAAEVIVRVARGGVRVRTTSPARRRPTTRRSSG